MGLESARQKKMEIRKIKFEKKEDVNKQGWWENCNIEDCSYWKYNKMVDAQLGHNPYCRIVNDAKTTIWL